MIRRLRNVDSNNFAKMLCGNYHEADFCIPFNGVKMRTSVFTLAVIVFLGRAVANGDSKHEVGLLAGKWSILSLDIDGKTQPPEKPPKSIVIAGNKLSGIGPEMTMTLDSTKKPKWIDLSFKKADKEYSIRGIYRIEGDELLLCIPMAIKGKLFENKRPATFDTAGKGVALFKAKRTK